MADHTDGMTVHLAHRDVSFVAVSRAPLAEIERFRQRMGWKFRWVSSSANDFNKDFHVSFEPEDRVDGAVYYNYGMTGFPNTEAPGISVFYKDDAGEIFHTYSTFGRGVEVMMGTYSLLDLVPKGRDEHDGSTRWTGCAITTATSRRRDGRAGRGLVLRSEGLRPAPSSERARHGELWPWLAIAGVGALHGLSPANGWLLAAACGVHARDEAAGAPRAAARSPSARSRR